MEEDLQTHKMRELMEQLRTANMMNMATFPPVQPKPHPESWINIIIERRDGREPVTLNIQGTKGLLQHVLRESKETGFIVLWSDTETIGIPVTDVDAIKVTMLTKEVQHDPF